MPDLGVAHLAIRQADVAPTRRQRRVRVAGPELVEDRRRGLADRVARARRSQAPAVEHDQRQRGTGTAAARRGGSPAAPRRRSPRRSSGSRLAPPTRAPSMSVRGEQLGGVVRLHGAAVEDPDRLAGRLRRGRATSERMKAIASAACSGVALRPVPIAQTGS